MTRWVTEVEFAEAVRSHGMTRFTREYPGEYRSVTGPGRSGAVAAVYVSHATGLPFVPFGQRGPAPVLVVDTTAKSGRTMRAALRRVERLSGDAAPVLIIPPKPGERLKFWYEALRTA